jgi:hypothetical protein
MAVDPETEKSLPAKLSELFRTWMTGSSGCTWDPRRSRSGMAGSRPSRGRPG